MADALERFLNWQSDQDWTWGPFVSLRPSRDASLRPWVWLRLFLIFTLLGIAALGFLVLIGLAVPLAASQWRYPLPPPLTETWTTLGAMLADPGTQRHLFGLIFSLPLLFFLFCLPYHWAWNRRALRLRQAEEGTVEAEKGVAGV